MKLRKLQSYTSAFEDFFFIMNTFRGVYHKNAMNSVIL